MSVSDELTNTADAVTTPMEDQATAVPTAVSGAGTWPITAPPAVDLAYSNAGRGCCEARHVCGATVIISARARLSR